MAGWGGGGGVGYNLIHVASDSAKPALKLLGERVLHMKKSSESRGGGGNLNKL